MATPPLNIPGENSLPSVPESTVDPSQFDLSNLINELPEPQTVQQSHQALDMQKLIQSIDDGSDIQIGAPKIRDPMFVGGEKQAAPTPEPMEKDPMFVGLKIPKESVLGGVAAATGATPPLTAETKTGKRAIPGTKVKPLAQSNSFSCGQTAVAQVINAVKAGVGIGSSIDDNYINKRHGFALNAALNTELNDSGAYYQDVGNYHPSMWNNLKKSVKEGLPAIIGLGGRFTSSGIGHIVTVADFIGDNMVIADPNEGKTYQITRKEYEENEGHTDGKFVFMGKWLHKPEKRQPSETISTSVSKPGAAGYKLKALKFAQDSGINRPDILQEQWAQESGYDPNAISEAGAGGLTQIMPSTFEDIKRDLGDEITWAQFMKSPGHQLRYGNHYMSQQLKTFGTYPRALAAYNMGPGALRTALGMGELSAASQFKEGPIPGETLDYVKRTLKLDSRKEAENLIRSTKIDESLLYNPKQTSDKPAAVNFDVTTFAKTAFGNVLGLAEGMLPEELFSLDGSKLIRDTFGDDVAFGAEAGAKKGAQTAQGFTWRLGDLIELIPGVPKSPWREKGDTITKSDQLFLSALYGKEGYQADSWRSTGANMVFAMQDSLAEGLGNALGAYWTGGAAPIAKVEGETALKSGKLLLNYFNPISKTLTKTDLVRRTTGALGAGSKTSAFLNGMRAEWVFAEAYGQMIFHKVLGQELREGNNPVSSLLTALKSGAAEATAGLAIGSTLRWASLGGEMVTGGIKGSKSLVADRMVAAEQSALDLPSDSFMARIVDKGSQLLGTNAMTKIRGGVDTFLSKMDQAAYVDMNRSSKELISAFTKRHEGVQTITRAKVMSEKHAKTAQVAENTRASSETALGDLSTQRQKLAQVEETVSTKKAEYISQDPLRGEIVATRESIVGVRGVVADLRKQVAQAEFEVRKAAATGNKQAAREAQKTVVSLKESLDTEVAAQTSLETSIKERRKSVDAERGAGYYNKQVEEVRKIEAEHAKTKKAIESWDQVNTPKIESLTEVMQSAEKTARLAGITKDYYDQVHQTTKQKLLSGQDPNVERPTEDSFKAAVDELPSLPHTTKTTTPLDAYNYYKSAEEQSALNDYIALREGNPGFNDKFGGNLFLQDDVTPTSLRMAATALEKLVGDTATVRNLRASADAIEPYAQKASKELEDRLTREAPMGDLTSQVAGELAPATPRPDVEKPLFAKDNEYIIKQTRAKEAQRKADLEMQETLRRYILDTKEEINPSFDPKNNKLSQMSRPARFTPQDSAVSSWAKGPIKGKEVTPLEPPLSEYLVNKDTAAFNSMFKEEVASLISPDQASFNPTKNRINDAGLKDALPEEADLDARFDQWTQTLGATETQKRSLLGYMKSLFSIQGSNQNRWKSMKAFYTGMSNHIDAGRSLAADMADFSKTKIQEGYAEYRTGFADGPSGRIEEGTSEIAKSNPISKREFEDQVLDLLYEANPKTIAKTLEDNPGMRTALRPLLKMIDLVEGLKKLSPDLDSSNFLDVYFPVFRERITQVQELAKQKNLDPTVNNFVKSITSEKERVFKNPSEARAAHRRALKYIGENPKGFQEAQKAAYAKSNKNAPEGRWLNFVTSSRTKQRETLRNFNRELAVVPEKELDIIVDDTIRGLLVGEPTSDLPGLIQHHVGSVYQADAKRMMLRQGRAIDVDADGKVVPMVATQKELEGVGLYRNDTPMGVSYGKEKKSSPYVKLSSKNAEKLRLATAAGDSSDLYVHPELNSFLETQLKGRDWVGDAIKDTKNPLLQAMKDFYSGVKGLPLMGFAGPYRHQVYGRFAQAFNHDLLAISQARDIGESLTSSGSHIQYLMDQHGFQRNNWQKASYGVSNVFSQDISKSQSGVMDFLQMPKGVLDKFARENPELYNNWKKLKEEADTDGTELNALMKKHNELDQQVKQEQSLKGQASESLLAAFDASSKVVQKVVSWDGYAQNHLLFQDLNHIAQGYFIAKVDQLTQTKLPELLKSGMDYDDAMRGIYDAAAHEANIRQGTVKETLKSPTVSSMMKYLAQTPNLLYTKFNNVAASMNHVRNVFDDTVYKATGRKVNRGGASETGAELHPVLRKQMQADIFRDVMAGTANMLITATGLNYMLNNVPNSDLGAGGETSFNVNGLRVDLPQYKIYKGMAEMVGLPTLARTSGLLDISRNPTDKDGRYSDSIMRMPAPPAGLDSGNSVINTGIEALVRAGDGLSNQMAWMWGAAADMQRRGANAPDFVKENTGFVRDLGGMAAATVRAGQQITGLDTHEGMLNDALDTLIKNPNSDQNRNFWEIALNSTLGFNVKREQPGEKGLVQRLSRITQLDTPVADDRLKKRMTTVLSKLGDERAEAFENFSAGDPRLLERLESLDLERDRQLKKFMDPNEEMSEAEFSERLKMLAPDGAPTRAIATKDSVKYMVRQHYYGADAQTFSTLQRQKGPWKQGIGTRYEAAKGNRDGKRP